jgi:uncharacterized phage-like protein YoqJ
MDKRTTVSFSGYIPEKFTDSGAENTSSLINLKAELRNVILESVHRGFDTFIVGMADGFDMFAAEEVIKIKAANPHIKLVATISFDDGSSHLERYDMSH